MTETSEKTIKDTDIDIPDDTIADATAPAFERLLDRSATDKEKLNLYKIKQELRLGDDDALWMIFVALQYHLALYDEIPQKINESVKTAIEDMQIASARMTDQHCELITQHAASVKAELTKVVKNEITGDNIQTTKQVKQVVNHTKSHPWSKTLCMFTGLFFVVLMISCGIVIGSYYGEFIKKLFVPH